MAVLTIHEVATIGRDQGAGAQVAVLPVINEQSVAISGVSTQCPAFFNKNTRYLRFRTDVACSIAIGTNPTATVPAPPQTGPTQGILTMSAGQCEYFELDVADPTTIKAAVIAIAA